MEDRGRSSGCIRPLLLAVALVFASLDTQAACLPYTDSTVESLARLIGRDPAAAARTAKEQIAALTGPATPVAQPARLAGLYGVLADASSALELDQDALAAARKGLALAQHPRDPNHINLAYTHGINTYDKAGMQVELGKLETLLARQVPGSVEETCVLIGLGLLQHQAVRDDLSTISLTRAFRLSGSPALREQRIHAAKGLMYIARNVGDFDQALALNQELLDWYKVREDAFELAGAYYARGQIERYRGDHRQALHNFQYSRQLRVTQSLPQNLAFADMRICGSYLELGSLGAARTHCESALRMLDAAQSPSTRKETMALLADVDLREGKPAVALSRLNTVLNRLGDDLLPARVPGMFELRARAHTALGHYREAMRDQDAFLRLYKEQLQAERNLQAAVLRAQLETERQMERNTALQQQLVLNGGRLRSMLYAAAAGSVILLLLVYLLVANRRQARELARLADTDALTGLPNRRRTAELARRMIERAASNGTAVTIAIIDIDHFKSINDRFGHATGDRVLQEFAHNARVSLRETDLIGRWGGEEFLAALPDTELDVASQVLERVRVKLNAMPEHAGSTGLGIRVSVGLASSGTGNRGLDEIVAQADIALYQAKHAGRDTMRVAQQSFDAASTSVREALHVAGMSITTGRFRRPATALPVELVQSG